MTDIQTYFLVPFARMEEGFMIRSIIAWNKRPAEVQAQPAPVDSDHIVEMKTTLWEYQLHINLWFVIFRIRFFSSD